MAIKAETILFWGLLFSISFQTVLNLNFANEFLFMILLFLSVFVEKKLNRNIIITVGFFFLLFCYSIYVKSNQLMAIVQDFTTVSKPFLIALLANNLKHELSGSLKKIIFWICVLFLIFNCLVYFLGLVEHVYKAPYQLAGSCAVLYVISLYCIDCRNRIRHLFLLLLLSVGFIASWQGKHLVFFAVSSFLLFYFLLVDRYRNGRKTQTKIVVFALFFILISSALVSTYKLAINDLQFYYMRNDATVARAAFLINLPNVLSGHYLFFGRGYGTYGSQASGSYYSYLYKELNMDKIYGLAEGNAMFVNDAYYAMFIGQFGLIGIVFFFVFWIYIIKPFWLYFKKKKYLHKEYLILFFTCLMWCPIFIFGSGLFNSQGCFIMLAIGLARKSVLQDLNYS